MSQKQNMDFVIKRCPSAHRAWFRTVVTEIQSRCQSYVEAARCHAKIRAMSKTRLSDVTTGHGALSPPLCPQEETKTPLVTTARSSLVTYAERTLYTEATSVPCSTSPHFSSIKSSAMAKSGHPSTCFQTHDLLWYNGSIGGHASLERPWWTPSSGHRRGHS